jgi:hypothetical protein
MRVLAAEYSRLEVTAPQPLTLLGLRPSHGQAGSYPFGRRISTDKWDEQVLRIGETEGLLAYSAAQIDKLLPSFMVTKTGQRARIAASDVKVDLNASSKMAVSNVALNTYSNFMQVCFSGSVTLCAALPCDSWLRSL